MENKMTDNERIRLRLIYWSSEQLNEAARRRPDLKFDAGFIGGARLRGAFGSNLSDAELITLSSLEHLSAPRKIDGGGFAL
jgi:hypothetical protein